MPPPRDPRDERVCDSAVASARFTLSRAAAPACRSIVWVMRLSSPFVTPGARTSRDNRTFTSPARAKRSERCGTTFRAFRLATWRTLSGQVAYAATTPQPDIDMPMPTSRATACGASLVSVCMESVMGIDRVVRRVSGTSTRILSSSLRRRQGVRRCENSPACANATPQRSPGHVHAEDGNKP